jgi:hypothetical protein
MIIALWRKDVYMRQMTPIVQNMNVLMISVILWTDANTFQMTISVIVLHAKLMLVFMVMVSTVARKLTRKLVKILTIVHSITVTQTRDVITRTGIVTMKSHVLRTIVTVTMINAILNQKTIFVMMVLIVLMILAINIKVVNPKQTTIIVMITLTAHPIPVPPVDVNSK